MRVPAVVDGAATRVNAPPAQISQQVAKETAEMISKNVY